MEKKLFEETRQLMNSILETRYCDLELERVHAVSLLEIAIRENDSYCLAFAYTYLGDYFIANNDNSNCAAYLHKAEHICLQNTYRSLLIRVYNLFGICYEALSDEQTAFQYYLKAITLAKEQKDDMYLCILYNNIASEFAIYQDQNQENALKYYELACEIINTKNLTFSNSDYIPLRVLTNTIEVCTVMGKLEEAATLLDTCSQFNKGVEDARDLLVSRGWCGYHVAAGDYHAAALSAGRFLEALEANHYDDTFLLHELMLSLCEHMITIRHQEYARALLDKLISLRSDSELEKLQQVQRVSTQYYEAFGTKEECQQAYYEYYQMMIRADAISRQVRARGLKNILDLNEIRNSLYQEKQNLNEEAHMDELTALFNRRYFNKLIAKYTTDASVTSLGFIMLDIDYFKEYNDTYGHTMGDEILHSIGQILKSCVPDSIIPCRYGGDEFCCLCTNASCSDIEDYIRDIQERLERLAVPHKTSRCAQCITLSIGYSNVDWTTDMDDTALLSHADQALYSSKSAGRNQFMQYKG